MKTQTGTFYEKYTGEGNMFMSSAAYTDSASKCALWCIQSQSRCIGFTFEKKISCDLLDSLILGSSTSNNTWISGNE